MWPETNQSFYPKVYECIWIKCFLLSWVLPLNKMKVVRKNVISFVMLHLTTIVLMSLCCQWLIEESGTHEIPSRWCRWKMVNTGMHWQSLCWLSLPCRSQCYHSCLSYSQFCFSHRLEEEKGKGGRRKGGCRRLRWQGHQVEWVLWGDE